MRRTAISSAGLFPRSETGAAAFADRFRYLACVSLIGS